MRKAAAIYRRSKKKLKWHMASPKIFSCLVMLHIGVLYGEHQRDFYCNFVVCNERLLDWSNAPSEAEPVLKDDFAQKMIKRYEEFHLRVKTRSRETGIGELPIIDVELALGPNHELDEAQLRNRFEKDLVELSCGNILCKSRSMNLGDYLPTVLKHNDILGDRIALSKITANTAFRAPALRSL